MNTARKKRRAVTKQEFFHFVSLLVRFFPSVRLSVRSSVLVFLLHGACCPWVSVCCSLDLFLFVFVLFGMVLSVCQIFRLLVFCLRRSETGNHVNCLSDIQSIRSLLSFGFLLKHVLTAAARDLFVHFVGFVFFVSRCTRKGEIIASFSVKLQGKLDVWSSSRGSI